MVSNSLTQLRVKSLQKRFVKILHRALGLKLGEKSFLVHPVERITSLIQHLRQLQRLEFAGQGDLLKQG